jgi:hypothetical protein
VPNRRGCDLGGLTACEDLAPAGFLVVETDLDL